MLDFLVEENYMEVAKETSVTGAEVYEKKAIKTALRNIQCWLIDFGYSQGKRTGNLVPNQDNMIKRHEYLRLFFANRAKPEGERLREVYTDESYIHEHYNQNNNSLWDPNDKEDVQTKKDKHKGRRYCFCCAIQGPKPGVVENDSDQTVGKKLD